MRHTFALILSLLFVTFAQAKVSTSRHKLYVNDQMETDSAHYTFKTVNEALIFAQKDKNHWTEIRIEPSVYWIDDPDDPAIRTAQPGQSPSGLKVKLEKVRLIGLSSDPKDVVLACNRGQTQGSEGNFTMLGIEGSDIEAENITFGNYCNVDLVYDRDPKLSRPKRNAAVVQAQLAICHGDRYKMTNCRFISRLNLCPFSGPDHVYFDHCYFECTDDALCGTGTYVHCGFTFYSSKPFYATCPEGSEFIDCDIHSKVHGHQYLTKASSPVRMTDCRWTSDDPDLVIGWTPKPNPKDYCCMTNCTLNGKPYDLGPTPDVPMPVAPVSLQMQAQTEIIPGQWTLDLYKPSDTNHYNWDNKFRDARKEVGKQTFSPWCFSEGVDAAEGYFGLCPNVRGARMMYTGREGETYKGQMLSVTLHPCKELGQGFGSATGQYLDLCIKFDPRTLTGYGLRFIRTPQHDNAVDIYLVEYKNGEIEQISEAQTCYLFHVGCHINLSLQGKTLKAVVSNDTFATKDAEGKPIAQEISATIAEPNSFGGIEIQHTGTLGPSSLVISEIHSSYLE